VDCGKVVFGRRVQLYFSTRAEAETFAATKRMERDKFGRAAFTMDEMQRQDAARAYALLDGTGLTLQQAATIAREHTLPDGGKHTFTEVLVEFLAAKQAAGRRFRTLESLKHRLGKFGADKGSRLVNEITSGEIEEWLNGNEYAGTTRGHFITCLFGFFNFAMKRRYLPQNPASILERPTVDGKVPEIFTVDEIRKLFDQAKADCPKLIPYLALCTFAGLRPNEARLLDWEAVNIEKRAVMVVPAVAKKRRMRYVEMSENLAAWLAPHKRATGRIWFLRHVFDSVRIAAGLRWVPDGLRHSYASYHLAQHENVNKTSMQLGHVGSSMLFDHYRNLVTREDAVRFWNIRPDNPQEGRA
jgi:integrase